ncbi:hypothetical protein R3P38DRAFT_3070338 [Favolaschia claudopus]|uniref:Uncharacterized protein n=1 Tax=Favolaschia claudopus TaxID=2862362 RepID=A0AAW0A089_9AGAR
MLDNNSSAAAAQECLITLLKSLWWLPQILGSERTEVVALWNRQTRNWLYECPPSDADSRRNEEDRRRNKGFLPHPRRGRIVNLMELLADEVHKAQLAIMGLSYNPPTPPDEAYRSMEALLYFEQILFWFAQQGAIISIKQLYMGLTELAHSHAFPDLTGDERQEDLQKRRDQRKRFTYLPNGGIHAVAPEFHPETSIHILPDEFVDPRDFGAVEIRQGEPDPQCPMVINLADIESSTWIEYLSSIADSVEYLSSMTDSDICHILEGEELEDWLAMERIEIPSELYGLPPMPTCAVRPVGWADPAPPETVSHPAPPSNTPTSAYKRQFRPFEVYIDTLPPGRKHKKPRTKKSLEAEAVIEPPQKSNDEDVIVSSDSEPQNPLSPPHTPISPPPDARIIMEQFTQEDNRSIGAIVQSLKPKCKLCVLHGRFCTAPALPLQAGYLASRCQCCYELNTDCDGWAALCSGFQAGDEATLQYLTFEYWEHLGSGLYRLLLPAPHIADLVTAKHNNVSYADLVFTSQPSSSCASETSSLKQTLFTSPSHTIPQTSHKSSTSHSSRAWDFGFDKIQLKTLTVTELESLHQHLDHFMGEVSDMLDVDLTLLKMAGEPDTEAGKNSKGKGKL